MKGPPYVTQALQRVPLLWLGVRRSPLHWKLLKPYAEVDSKDTMVVIQCPHCGEDVELEDGTSGLFDCPYCDGEFEWENHNRDLVNNSNPFGRNALVHQLKIAGKILLITVISMLVLVFFAFLFDECSRSCSLENSFGWTFYLAIIAAPVWIPVSFIPSIIYLVRYCLKSLQNH